MDAFAFAGGAFSAWSQPVFAGAVAEHALDIERARHGTAGQVGFHSVLHLSFWLLLLLILAARQGLHKCDQPWRVSLGVKGCLQSLHILGRVPSWFIYVASSEARILPL